MERKNEFADMIKKKKDVELLNLNRENFARAFTEVRKWLKRPLLKEEGSFESRHKWQEGRRRNESSSCC